MHEPYTRTQKNRMFPTGIIRKRMGITGNPSRRRKRFCRRQPAFAPSTGAKGGGIDNSGEQEKIIHILYEGGIALSDTGNPV